MRRAIPGDWHGSPLAWRMLRECANGKPLFTGPIKNKRQAFFHGAAAEFLRRERLISARGTVTPLGRAALEGRPRANGWHSPELEHLRELLDAGLPRAAIAERMGRTLNAVSRMVFKLRQLDALRAVIDAARRGGASEADISAVERRPSAHV